MGKRRKLISFILIAVFLVTMSGCMKLKSTITINKDGSVDETKTVVVVPAMKTELDKQRKDLEKDKTLTLKDYSEDNMQGYAATRHYKSIEDLQSIQFYKNDGIVEPKGIRILHSWFADKYFINVLMRPGKDFSRKDEDVTQAEDVFGKGVVNSMMSQIEMKLQVNLPPGVLVDDSNTATIQGDDAKGKSLIWNINVINNTPIVLKTTVWNKVHIYLTILSLFTALGVAVFFGIKKRINKKYVVISGIAGWISLGIVCFSAYSYYQIGKTSAQIIKEQNNEIQEFSKKLETVVPKKKTQPAQPDKSGLSKNKANNAQSRASDTRIYINADETNVRSGPGTNYKILGVLNNNIQIQILDKQQDWYRIKRNGHIGYVFSKFVTIQYGNGYFGHIIDEKPI